MCVCVCVCRGGKGLVDYLGVWVSGVYNAVGPQLSVSGRDQGLFVELNQALSHQLNHVMVFVQFM